MYDPGGRHRQRTDRADRISVEVLRVIEGLVRFIPGWVRVEAEGGYPERLLNDLVRDGVALWRVHRREEWVRFSCPAADYRHIRPFARRAGVRMRMRHKHGLPFWWHRYRHRKGLLVGLCLYGLILALLAPRIWVIEVVGNQKTPTESVLQVVEQRGVRLGACMSDVDVKGVQNRGSDQLDTVVWMTVNPHGCVARVEVVERDPTPQVIDLTGASELVAVRDGKILEIESRSGQTLVKAGEAVAAGTVLISGRGDAETGRTPCRAYGAVWAETRRRITVSVPLKDSRMVAAGKPVSRPVFSFLCWDFPLYSSSPLQGEYTRKEARHYLTVGERELPLGFTVTTMQRMVSEPFIRTEQEALQEAQTRLAQQEQVLFLPDSYEKIAQTGRVKGGRYVLTATYVCRENIAVEVPLESVE
ncbi:MAG: hypothetical protein E7527_05835 [Ruminococcaceae bacterium]|nr:hypothetical protein [Oscillospiraceae bacterium]